jgi:hypothetical protein
MMFEVLCRSTLESLAIGMNGDQKDTCDRKMETAWRWWHNGSTECSLGYKSTRVIAHKLLVVPR